MLNVKLNDVFIVFWNFSQKHILFWHLSYTIHQRGKNYLKNVDGTTISLVNSRKRSDKGIYFERVGFHFTPFTFVFSFFSLQHCGWKLLISLPKRTKKKKKKLLHLRLCYISQRHTHTKEKIIICVVPFLPQKICEDYQAVKCCTWMLGARQIPIRNHLKSKSVPLWFN